MNSVNIVGRLTADPELRRTDSGIAVCSITLAVARPMTKDVTDFVDCVVWRQAAEFLKQYAGKGDRVAITGILQGRTWNDKEGRKRKAVEVVAQTAELLSSKRNSEAPCNTAKNQNGNPGSTGCPTHVLDARTGIQVAVLQHQFDTDQYTRQMYCLGKYYKDALIGIEANFDSYPIRELQRLGYPKQYTREASDTYTGKTERRFGFKTTSLTRPTVISRLIEIVREHCGTINDRDTLEELLTIVRNEKGRIEAPQGGHDDMMMGLAIAHEIRSQVVFPSDVITVAPERHFASEKKMFDISCDYGETITIV